MHTHTYSISLNKHRFVINAGLGYTLPCYMPVLYLLLQIIIIIIIIINARLLRSMGVASEHMFI